MKGWIALAEVNDTKPDESRLIQFDVQASLYWEPSEDKTLSYLPILLKLRDRPCLVVGGGPSAVRVVEALLKADARLTVISPQVTEFIKRLAANGGRSCFPGPMPRATSEVFISPMQPPDFPSSTNK
jgi:radical SAM superfamily enzyme YgiQ (UPF0313 family)